MLLYLTRLLIWMISLPNSKTNQEALSQIKPKSNTKPKLSTRLTLSAGAKRDLQSISNYTQKQWGAAQK